MMWPGSCQRTQEILSADGAGDASGGRGRRRARAERHAAACAACRAALAERRRLAAVLDEWRAPAPKFESSAAEFEERLRARIAVAAARHSLPGAGWWRPWREAGGEFAAALAAAARRSGLAGALAAALLLALLAGGGAWVHRQRVARDQRVLAERGADAAVRDLQVLNRDGDMLEHFDLISEQPALSNGAAGPGQAGEAPGEASEVANP